MVQRGKPAALLPVQERYLEAIVSYISSTYKLHVHTERLAEHWLKLWIYKDEHILEVINSLPPEPKSIFDHWTLGKLFGYSEEAIKEYLDYL